MTAPTIDALREALGDSASVDAEYTAKQLHAVPALPVVDRVAFLLSRAHDRRVLEFGASGPMHDGLRQVAREVVGVDRVATDGVVACDLDDVSQAGLPIATPDLIICGEVLEHLSNPGWFLTRLKRQYPSIPVIVTVPNGFSAIAQSWMRRGIENVNREHVAWYSYITLTTLLTRHGFTMREAYWYHGSPRTAEGLIAVVE